MPRRITPRKVEVRGVESLESNFRKLTKQSMEEGVEYHAEIYRYKGGVRLTKVRRGSKFEVRASPHREGIELERKGATRIGAFHTHPQGRGEASFRDEMAYMVSEGIKNPGKSFDVIGSREGIRVRSVTPEQRKTKWYQKVTNLSLKFMTGSYGVSRAEGMFERYKKKHGYGVKVRKIPLRRKRST